ncbi:hypothetical protein [Xiashengella succiniciproducens]|uniref:Lipoprotein n=1 Tax=Xiashengella succiniciproducens TaxID=2949635 RepID=A0A9J6ZTT2_9BACT|nr:hypothetical protein [Alkaliflexus sp. Ai-910]URW80776.1 hypothetical protein M9189_05350 [Alkaliflexus sp. Ai-910]
MKNVILSLLMLACCNACSSQVKFREFTNNFKPLELPLDNILNLTNRDTLDGKFTNDIIIRSQDKRPQYVDKDGTLKTIRQYYGLYPEEPFKYTSDEKKNGKWIEINHTFYNKIIPIGRINLNDNYESLIIKVVAIETTFYDLWNFSKDGKALSVICLFWGMRDAGPQDEKVTFTIIDSNITKEGNIVWYENADGLETFRTYKLNDEGHFQIIKEEQKGEAEF